MKQRAHWGDLLDCWLPGKGQVFQCKLDAKCVVLHVLAAIVMDVEWDRGAAARHGEARHFNFGVLGSDAVESA